MTVARALRFIDALRAECGSAADFRSRIEAESGHPWDEAQWQRFVARAQLDGRAGHELRMALIAGAAAFAEHVLALLDGHAEGARQLQSPATSAYLSTHTRGEGRG